MLEFETLLSSINGRAAQNLERLTTISGSLKVGGWIAKWGSWQVFKHDVSDKCSVVRGVAVSMGDATPQCVHKNSAVCVIQVSGSSCIETNGDEVVAHPMDMLSIQPGTRFTINPRESGAEILLVLVPPTPTFDELYDASSLMGVCEGSRD